MEAAWFGHADSVSCLLELGADPSLTDQQDMGGKGGGRTARDFAIKENHQDIIDILDR